MKNTCKKFLMFLPLIISILVYCMYCGIELGVLSPQGLSWRPYVTFGMLVVITLGLVSFCVLLICRLLRGLKNQSIGKKALRLISALGLGGIAACVVMWGVIFMSLSYTHEKVIKTDDTRYISCLSDWNPIYYHYHEYDSCFTMVKEPFESIKNENISEWDVDTLIKVAENVKIIE